ncbi:glycosyltransferase [Aeromicrobium sp. SMF47]|uniref:glycosyltransferase n=1 Tax=Aeromicrobium yanjiei TaxID=2662028 RepID=UPI00129D8F02|nr:glycosyltransferase family A protein [Aeromicrobium yanjiei]MRJ75233.1 glycosyltransferase [Aeromicrobium yanjiei]
MSPQTPGLPPHLVDLADSGVVSAARLAATLLRYEYADSIELLARMASRGTYTADQIIGIAADLTHGRPVVDRALTPLHAPGTYALAYLELGLAFGSHGDFTAAADLFALARKIADRDGVPYEYDRQDVQVHLAVGRVDYVRQHTSHANPDVVTNDARSWYHWAANTDIINPFRGVEPASLETWQQAFNAPFIDRGLAPMTFEATATPFDTVRTNAAAGSVDGPLISIVMPVYAPTRSLLTAARSVLDQTWGNVEVIVVDDHSPEGHEDIFEEVRALSDRVSYHRMPQNGGAYRARNLGLSLARGELAGIQDGDDWSHPQRLERQMAAFARDKRLVATLSKSIRLHTDLYMTRVGSLPFAHNAPSLLFKREAVLGRLGPFDQMRKAADTEYIERIAAVFGQQAVTTLKEPLSLYQLTDGSLSREDFRPSWHRPARVSYHSAFRHWHHRIRTEGIEPRSPDAEGRRPFPAPPELEGTTYPDTSPDVVVLTDPRPGPQSGSGVAGEIAALHADGLRVGLARTDALRFASQKRHYPRADLLDLMAHDVTSWMTLGAPVSPTVLLIRDVELLALPRSTDAVAMTPQRVVVIADRMPSEGTAPRVSWEPPHIEAAVRRMFNRPAEWIPATEEIGRAIWASGVTGTVHPPRLMEIATVARFPRRRIGERLVLGIADPSAYPVEQASPAELARLLPPVAHHDVRVLQDPTRPAPAVPGVLAFSTDIIAASEFYDQCDVVVVPAPAVAGSALLRPAVEAMARGCVVIADPALRGVLGEAALYLDDGPLEQLLDKLTTDPALLAEQQGRSLAFCQTELSAAAYVAAIRTLTTTGGSR